MQVGIITFHFVYNCGAVLQALALQKTLSGFGVQTFIINYQPWYHKNRYCIFENPICALKKATARNRNFFKKILSGLFSFFKALLSWRFCIKNYRKDILFSTFTKKYFTETKLYRTNEQLKADAPKLDMYISGSDQLWNAKLTENHIDPAYMLDFGTDHVRRITYSIGSDFSHFNGCVSELKPFLKRLDAISLRESNNFDLIRNLTDKEVYMHIDIDPTLLLNEKDYDEYIFKGCLCNEPFIFTYTMPDRSQKNVYSIAKSLSKKYGIKIIDASGNPQNANRTIEDSRLCGPAEFLWYMKNAAFIVTNSFHGTAFSIIYKKEFLAVPHSSTGNRVTELLDKLSLADRYTFKDEEEAISRFFEKCDYTIALQKLDSLREESKKYIYTQISIKG